MEDRNHVRLRAREMRQRESDNGSEHRVEHGSCATANQSRRRRKLLLQVVVRAVAEGKDQSASCDAHFATVHFLAIKKSRELQHRHFTFLTALSKEMDRMGPSQHIISANVAPSSVGAARAAATRCTIHVIIFFSLLVTSAETDGRATSMPATLPHNALS